MKLAVVTASVDPERTQPYWSTWQKHSTGEYVFDHGINRKPIGTVPAFLIGVEAQIADGADIIACLHDDLRIDEDGWDEKIVEHFRAHPRTGLLGFSGCDGLGEPGMYSRPYDPMTLARRGFFSNLEDAESHGRRETTPMLSAACDGFSLIGSAAFFGMAWPYVAQLGVRHHAYDSWMGALARRHRLETWFLPIKCKHAGGVTAVANEEYQRWAEKQGGDHELWKQAHLTFWHDAQDVLPFVVR